MTKAYDVIAIGVAAIDDLMYLEGSYPPSNTKVPVAEKQRHCGGPACTAIASVGTLGGRGAFSARLGNDELSHFIEHQLQRRNVDVSHIIRDPDSAPYHSIIAVDLQGNRNVFYDASRFRSLQANDLQETFIRSTKIALLDCVSGDVPIELANRIRALGTPLVGDIESRSNDALTLASLVDYLVIPHEFALWASGTNTPRDACSRLAHSHDVATIVTAGSEGCYYALGKSGAVTHLPAFPVEALDTNGCGDTFHGALALALARDLSFADAILFASAAAAVKATGSNRKQRGWDALPTIRDVSELLHSWPDRQHRAILAKRIENHFGLTLSF